MLLIAMLVGGVTVTLRDSAHVSGAEVELALVAQVEGSDDAQVERLRGVSLGWAPAPGFSRWLDAAMVARELAQQAPGVAFELAGAPGCRVWPKVERVHAAAIEAAARGELARWFDGRDAQFTLSARIADIDVPAGERGSELRVVANKLDLHSGTLDLPVRVLVDGALHRTVWTSWSVDLWAVCSVPVHPIRAGEVFSAEMLEERRVPLLDRAAATPCATHEIVGAVAARDLPAGSPIGPDQIVQPTLIERGASISLEVRRGRVAARLSVVADQSGKRGERIRVVQPGTDRVWSARVVSRELALLEVNHP